LTDQLLTRRAALLLPLILAACGSDEEPPGSFPPLRYDYLPPIGLNVAAIDIRQQFVPSGARPDVTAQDPVTPIAALRAMGEDRLKALGTSQRATFAILDGTLTQRGDSIDGSMLVALTIYSDDGRLLGEARAQVNRHRSGDINSLHRTLYDFTKAMMDSMNVEFEYQVRHTLKAFIIEPAAPEAPVQQTPLNGNQPPPPSSGLQPPSSSLQPPSSAPTQLAPPASAPDSGMPAPDPYSTMPPPDPYAVQPNPYGAPPNPYSAPR
jgi:hypothetical protein